MMKSVLQSIDPILSVVFMTGYVVVAWLSINKVLALVAVSTALGQTMLGSMLEMLDSIGRGVESMTGVTNPSDSQFVSILLIHGLLAASAWGTVNFTKAYFSRKSKERLAEYEIWLKTQNRRQ